MTQTTTNEKAPGTCDSKGLGTDTTNDLNFATGQRDDKPFNTARARSAFAGHALTRSNPKDGAVKYYLSRWGQTRELADLDAVASWLDRVVGAKS